MLSWRFREEPQFSSGQKQGLFVLCCLLPSLAIATLVSGLRHPLPEALQRSSPGQSLPGYKQKGLGRESTATGRTLSMYCFYAMGSPPINIQRAVKTATKTKDTNKKTSRWCIHRLPPRAKRKPLHATRGKEDKADRATARWTFLGISSNSHS